MPLDTILLLDTSGSMAGRGITELKRACNTFLDGVEETARQTGLKVFFRARLKPCVWRYLTSNSMPGLPDRPLDLGLVHAVSGCVPLCIEDEENVAVVVFHASATIVQSLTTDYARCRRAIDSLRAGGQTAMLDGLLESLKEILQNGGIVRVCGLAMTPRIILMTDGEPTDSAGSIEGKKKVVAAALGFGPGWRQLGLPHPVPIACVGCGSCDTELLQAIAKITNGMYAIVGNVSELSTFFRRQVLLIRFAMQFASDMERLRSQLALAAFLQELGEAVEEAELEAMMTLLLAMLVASTGDDSPPQAAPRPGLRAIASGPGPNSGVRATTTSSTGSTGLLATQARTTTSTTSITSRPSTTPSSNPSRSATSTTSSASRPTPSTTSASRPAVSTSSSTAVVRASRPSNSASSPPRGNQRSGSSCVLQ